MSGVNCRLPLLAALCVSACTQPAPSWPAERPAPIVHGLPFSRPSVFSLGITREGSSFAVYTLGRGADRKVEAIRYTWDPENGTQMPGRLVTAIAAMYGGDIEDYGISPGLLIEGLGDARVITYRYILNGRLMPFCSGTTEYEGIMAADNGQWATISDTEQWFLVRGSCIQQSPRCGGALWSTLLTDGGVHCGINNGGLPGHFLLHPSERLAALGARDFVRWSREGEVLEFVTDAGVPTNAKFWPSNNGPPRRISTETKYFFEEGTAEYTIREWAWEDGGVVSRPSHLARHFGRYGGDAYKTGDFIVAQGRRPESGNVYNNPPASTSLGVFFSVVFKDGSDEASHYFQYPVRHEYQGRFFSGAIAVVDGGWEIQEYRPEPVVEYPYSFSKAQ
jgi:hypothetical protein